MDEIQNLTAEHKYGIITDLTSSRDLQIDCILRMITDAVNKIKISILLPRIFKEVDQLEQIVEGTMYEKVIPWIKDFVKRRDRLVRMKATPLLDYRLVRLIDYFQENHKMITLFPADWFGEMTSIEEQLITSFELLYEAANLRLFKSAVDELTNERLLYRTFHENKTIKVAILDLKKKLFKQKLTLRWKMAAKEVYLQKFEDDLTARRWQNTLMVKTELKKCHDDIILDEKNTMEKQKELEEELENARVVFDKGYKINTNKEREARAEKNKLLLQLQGILKKYDQAMSDKLRERLALEKEYNVAKQQIDEYMVIYRYEESKYNKIVVKYEEKKRIEHQRRIILFTMNRAARIIQRYFRAWLKWQRKKFKKLNKDKKKKK